MTAPVAASERATGRVRLHFLDGVRGLAALYVLLFHSLTIDLPQQVEALSWPMRTLQSWFGYGHFAVVVFIVLSGFSLGLPIARSGVPVLGNGFRHYIWRRGRRVLPAYYAALVLSIFALIASAAVPGADATAREEALTPGSLVSHFLLVHNVDFDWVFRINGPMWSVATEWQIYFLFPFVLLPLWRRVGGGVTTMIAWVIPLAFHFSVSDTSNLAWAAPWLVGSFAMGVWGAFAMFGPDNARSSRIRTFPWAWTALGLFVFLVAVISITDASWELPILDLIVSAMSIAFINGCTRAYQRGRERETSRTIGTRLNGVLGSKSLVSLGAFSYSLYLLQHPLLRLTEAVLGEMSIGYETALWLQLLIGTPLIMLASRIFAEFFEMPFTTGSRVLNRVKAIRKSVASTEKAEPSVHA